MRAVFSADAPIDLPALVLSIHFLYLCITQSEGEAEEGDEEAGDKAAAPVEEDQKNKRLVKKRKLKERFDMEYDDGDAEATYFDDLKGEMQKQAEVSKMIHHSI